MRRATPERNNPDERMTGLAPVIREEQSATARRALIARQAKRADARARRLRDQTKSQFIGLAE